MATPVRLLALLAALWLGTHAAHLPLLSRDHGEMLLGMPAAVADDHPDATHGAETLQLAPVPSGTMVVASPLVEIPAARATCCSVDESTRLLRLAPLLAAAAVFGQAASPIAGRAGERPIPLFPPLPGRLHALLRVHLR
jgi:hypothetical protein